MVLNLYRLCITLYNGLHVVQLYVCHLNVALCIEWLIAATVLEFCPLHYKHFHYTFQCSSHCSMSGKHLMGLSMSVVVFLEGRQPRDQGHCCAVVETVVPLLFNIGD
jgi:hypothetical protein